MEVLSHEAIVNTLEKCSSLPRYQVGFIFSTARKADMFVENFMDIYNNDGIPGVSKVLKFSGGGRIVFDSDSVIQIIPCSVTGKGRRLHDLFWDEVVEEDYFSTLSGVFMPMLISYHGIPIPKFKRYDWTDNAESEALDEFFVLLETASQEV